MKNEKFSDFSCLAPIMLRNQLLISKCSVHLLCAVYGQSCRVAIRELCYWLDVTVEP